MVTTFSNIINSEIATTTLWAFFYLTCKVCTSIHCSSPVTTLCPLIDIQHPPFQMLLEVSAPSYLSPVDPIKFDFTKANYEDINLEISQTPWKNLLTGSVDDTINKFFAIINSIISSHVPPMRRRNCRFPICFTKALIIAIQQKDNPP